MQSQQQPLGQAGAPFGVASRSTATGRAPNDASMAPAPFQQNTAAQAIQPQAAAPQTMQQNVQPLQSSVYSTQPMQPIQPVQAQPIQQTQQHQQVQQGSFHPASAPQASMQPAQSYQPPNQQPAYLASSPQGPASASGSAFSASSSGSSNTDIASGQPSFLSRLQTSLKRMFQHYLDLSVPFLLSRWALFALLVVCYGVRVYYLQGFFIVTYGLGIFLLNLFIGFLSPVEDQDSDGPMLPQSSGDEFKPFVRRLPEFKFWYNSSRAVCIGFVMTFFSVFNIPVFWPILLVYFIVLFVLTMKRQIRHMMKHKYLPFSFGKKRYDGKDAKLKPSVAKPVANKGRAD